jgi:purine-binding chemotaxis protein CheW
MVEVLERLGTHGNGPDGGEENVFVTVIVAGQICGLPVRAVRDILDEQTIMTIPLTPPAIVGSLNLRGRIVTAIDLRCRLGLAPAPDGSGRMSVVIEQEGELYALVVDEVSEVVSLAASQYERNPSTLPARWATHAAGIYRLPSRLMVVLDVASLITQLT